MSRTYFHALDKICQPIHTGDYQPSLRPMRDLLTAIGSPHQRLKAVVVTGSTGKGTACHQLAQLLQASGRRVGLYTSPHLHSFRERFAINGQMISRDAFVAAANTVTDAAHRLPQHRYSTFEQATALALWWFDHQAVDMVVLEVGIGGRWDAVNVVDNVLALFTPIEMEHAAMLGGTLESIAAHKAGIIQPAGHAITVEQSAAVMQVLRQESTVKNAELEIVVGDTLVQAAWRNLHQRGLVTGDIPPVSFIPLPGRLERIEIGSQQLLIDGGHTPAGAVRLRHEIERIVGPKQPVRLIVGMLNDKNASAYLSMFDTPRFHIVLTQAPGHRAASPEAILARVQVHNATITIEQDLSKSVTPNGTEALTAVAGSLRMAAFAREVYGLLSPEMLAEAQATRAIFEGERYLGRLRD